ncbi:class I SAM-dependent methyltransferase [candidate division KSB3 bacterium]|uniref:Class I SAM-dependent methyltransferase n=1 Tax=candidate division KSB3 bacterium TaxID=2044937 RepID=A0A9D5Q6H1_9BACT|nr:class I SAM-dependent methyltransferase [candidate division KSB3 bacterium]MBD3325242.1 class I SAM-dependent methyltransferase [candidate division KSB3 bacterium]
MLRTLIKNIPGVKRFARLVGVKGWHDFLLDRLPKHSIGAEIGVHLGDFSQEVLDVLAPTELHLIDPWEYQPATIYQNAWYGGKAEGGQDEMDARYARVCQRFDRQIQAEQVKVHRGYSTDILAQFPDEYFDWIYIDGNHLYDYVKQDLELSLRKTKPDGFIAGDDYTSGGWWHGGVKNAVDEFAQHQTVHLLEIRNRQFIFRRHPAAGSLEQP